METEPNFWAFVVGEKIQVWPKPEIPLLEMQQILKEITVQLEHDVEGIQKLKRKLFMMDKTGSHAVSLEEFVIGLHYLGLDVREDELQILLKCFQHDQQGIMDVGAFMIELEKISQETS
eukprot:TRINITY_DN57394_c0_g1_i1.p4 TRINITY_DN57394_c0_g1~~TRINITY_DN57394_c0_g1_i1.p4  ORF type:complete len:119 (-),score=21.13 TRINITY_DN57394_c0_g1_i1:100-456(-)